MKLDCSTCDHYNRGDGDNFCLNKCPKFKGTIARENWRPCAPDLPPYLEIDELKSPMMSKTMLDFLKLLPLEMSIILIAKFWLASRIEEIGEFFNLTRSQIQRRLAEAIQELRSVMSKK